MRHASMVAREYLVQQTQAATAAGEDREFHDQIKTQGGLAAYMRECDANEEATRRAMERKAELRGMMKVISLLTGSILKYRARI